MNPWTWLLNILGGILSFFYDVIPEYGIAVILLTLLVGLALFPLTYKQTKSMKGMQEIQPEVRKLQKELKGNREELNKQLMALYQERGVSPAAGCLPLLVQMPIWFALYRVLWRGSGIPFSESKDSLYQVLCNANDLLYTVNEKCEPLTSTIQQGINIHGPDFSHVKFLGMNLLVRPGSAVDFGNILPALPYILLIAVIVVAGFYQQVQTTRKRNDNGNGDESSQAQTMQRAMRIMPVVFGFISWNFVSGLGLYFATSNAFRVAQQAVILRTTGNEEADGVTGQSHSSEEPSGPPQSSGPSKNASKKRNRKRRK